MAPKIARQRNQAFIQQAGYCYYCGLKMWSANRDEFAARHKIPRGLANRLQCTGEHLHARQDGGSDLSSNIVAACRFCNEIRHRRKNPPVPGIYRQQVRASISKGKWHPEQILAALLDT